MRSAEGRAYAAGLYLCAASFVMAPADAGPWMDTGDSALRNDVQMLSDAGVLHAPLTSWPLAWADVARDIKDVDDNLPPYLAGARQRVLRRYRTESRLNEVSPHLRAAAADHPRQFRTFEATPRDPGELEAGAEWTGSTFAYRLQTTAVAAPEDGKHFRLDGSYAAAILGNWAFSVGEQPRWWGPGWEGSLIISNNARPIPSVTVQRHRSDPFENKLLHWLGPWQFLFTFGDLGADPYVPNAKFIGMRLNFRPIPSLEIGASRTAQWGGQGRPESWSSFQNLVIGHDNVGSNGITAANEPGNQMGGFDFRWQSPLFNAPYAIYGQFIGEDEAGYLPSRYTGLAGVEIWGPWGLQGASWRLHAEYADTVTNSFFDVHPFYYDYAYQHHIYRSGYVYQGRIIGHSLGTDGRMGSLGLLYATAGGQSWDIMLRRIELDREVATSPSYYDMEVGHRFSWRNYTISLRVAGLQRKTLNGSDVEGQVDAQWEWHL